MASTAIVSKAELYAKGIQAITGERPVINYYADHAEIRFKPSQVKKLRESMESGKPSEVKIDFLPIAAPIVLKKLIPLAVGLYIAGIITAKL